MLSHSFPRIPQTRGVRLPSTMLGQLHPDLHSRALSSDRRSVNEADRCSGVHLTDEPSRGTRRARRSLARHSIQMFQPIRLLAPADAAARLSPSLPPATSHSFFLPVLRNDEPRAAISSCATDVPRIHSACIAVAVSNTLTAASIAAVNSRSKLPSEEGEMFSSR